MRILNNVLHRRHNNVILLMTVLLLLLSQKQHVTTGFIITTPLSVHSNKQQHVISKPLYMSIPGPIDTLTSGLASICRLPLGVTVRPEYVNNTTTSIQLKELYDIENSIECRRVRELITELDLVVDVVVPATKNSRVFTNKDYKYALKDEDSKIPRLVLKEQNNNEIILSGADDIINYFTETFSLNLGPKDDDDVKEKVIIALQEIGLYLAQLLRIGRGSKVCTAALDISGISTVPRPEQPLVLYSYEGNQFCRLVREVLTELDIPYELRSAGKDSPRRDELSETTGGSTQCPFLLDPNNDVAMAESADIIKYLYKNYALWTPPNELLQWISKYVMVFAKPIFTYTAPLQAGKDDSDDYIQRMAKAKSDIEITIRSSPVVIYTYGLSPFSSEAKSVLDNLNIEYTEISLGLEWIPGLLKSPETRTALLDMTKQSSLPHIFIGGTSIGGLYSGTPGLLPALEQGILLSMVNDAIQEQDSKLLEATSTSTTLPKDIENIVSKVATTEN